jgi:hypothetical protein
MRVDRRPSSASQSDTEPERSHSSRGSMENTALPSRRDARPVADRGVPHAQDITKTGSYAGSSGAPASSGNGAEIPENRRLILTRSPDPFSQLGALARAEVRVTVTMWSRWTDDATGIGSRLQAPPRTRARSPAHTRQPVSPTIPRSFKTGRRRLFGGVRGGPRGRSRTSVPSPQDRFCQAPGRCRGEIRANGASIFRCGEEQFSA